MIAAETGRCPKGVVEICCIWCHGTKQISAAKAVSVDKMPAKRLISRCENEKRVSWDERPEGPFYFVGCAFLLGLRLVLIALAVVPLAVKVWDQGQKPVVKALCARPGQGQGHTGFPALHGADRPALMVGKRLCYRL